MANKALFASRDQIKRADARNEAGGPAYRLSDKQTLAQLAATGTLNTTFYLDAVDQLDHLMAAAIAVEPEFLAKTAIYARRHAYMKDAPAVLLAVLASVSPELLTQVFPKVVDNGRMLRNFVQIMRSGATGRKSLGSRPKKLVQAWLNGASDDMLLRASVGASPSLADVIKMVHPTPPNAERAAFYAWLIGKPCDLSLLPQAVQGLIAFREGAGKGKAAPNVPFQLLTSLDLSEKQWANIALDGGWHMTRMNLNTFKRHGVLGQGNIVKHIAKKLANRSEVRRARAFPYQLMAAWMNIDADIPGSIKDALQIAMEISIENVPEIPGRVAVCPDVSGSMQTAVTGWRKGASSKISCVDVAALTASAVLRKNPTARVMPFDTKVREVRIRPEDSVLSNAKKLAMMGGGTACSAPLAKLNQEKAQVDLVILVSDNESWADRRWGGGTRVMEEWTALKRRNPCAKLVCLDIAPYATTPAYERPDIMNIGGFSDRVFELIALFAADKLSPDHWVGEIEKIALEQPSGDSV